VTCVLEREGETLAFTPTFYVSDLGQFVTGLLLLLFWLSTFNLKLERV
jgi:hypothetical protein